jgi:hypothetical protein
VNHLTVMADGKHFQKHTRWTCDCTCYNYVKVCVSSAGWHLLDSALCNVLLCWLIIVTPQGRGPPTLHACLPPAAALDPNNPHTYLSNGAVPS